MTWRDEFPDFDHPALFEWLLANAPYALDSSDRWDGVPSITCVDRVMLFVEYRSPAMRPRGEKQLCVLSVGDVEEGFRTDSPREAIAEIKRRLTDG